MPFDIFDRIRSASSRAWAKLDFHFTGDISGTNRSKDSMLESNRSSGPIDVPFDIFHQIRSRKCENSHFQCSDDISGAEMSLRDS